MRLFDSHCHIEDKVFKDDLAEVFARAREAQVQGIMIAGINGARSARAVALARHHAGVYAAVGVHPHHASQWNGEELVRLERLAEHETVKAWGEIGLDFNRMYSPPQAQERCFEAQLETAAHRKLPIILHERDSRGRLYEILASHVNTAGISGVVHCFSGSNNDLRRCLDLGLHVGVTGILTMATRGARLREQVAFIPQERLLIETDAPYLTPAPERNRHRRNEPAFVRSVWVRLAKLKQIPPETLAATLWSNTCRLFGISPQSSEKGG